jgi:hypothetical protein
VKAVEYAENFLNKIKNEEVDICIKDIYLAFFFEVEEISKQRRAERNDSLISIFREQSLKWKSFCRKVNPTLFKHGKQIPEDGFMRLSEKQMEIKLDI